MQSIVRVGFVGRGALESTFLGAGVGEEKLLNVSVTRSPLFRMFLTYSCIIQPFHARRLALFIILLILL